jgi:hypothetical protein
MKLEPEETDLRCEWDVVDGKVIGNAVCDRIDHLVSQYLLQVAGGGWETLYQDPYDGRYWELTYPQGEMHGGGPPRLTHLSDEQARAKYGNAIN